MRFHVPTVTRIVTIVAVEVTADIQVLPWRTNKLTEITANTQSIYEPREETGDNSASGRLAIRNSGRLVEVFICHMDMLLHAANDCCEATIS